MGSNQDQIDFWNGPRAKQWVEGQEIIDRQLAPFGDAAIGAAHLTAGEHIIDVGCGCGTATLALARGVGPTGSVLGVDVSEPMLAWARERAASLPHVRFVRSDASTYPFDGRLDCLFSRFGVMFFDDPLAAFTNLRRALRPGGRLAFACWRSLPENEWMAIPLAAVTPIVPDRRSLPPDAPGPFAFADPVRVRGVLEGSGFREVQFKPVDFDAPIGTGGVESATSEAIHFGPAARLLLEADEPTRVRAEAAVRAALTPWLVDGQVRMHAGGWIVTATNP